MDSFANARCNAPMRQARKKVPDDHEIAYDHYISHNNQSIPCSLHYNLPQKRERVIIVGFKENHPFEWPQHQPLKKTLAAVLEPDEAVKWKKFRLMAPFGTQFQNN